jgi:VCBS repeat-containing protein
MTKLASENATNKANAQGFSLKEGRAAVDGQVAVDPSVKTAVAAPLKAALNAKTGAGVAVPAPVKANAHADAVKKDERDEDGKHNNKASDETEGKVEHLAMVDASSAASVGALSPEAGQDTAAGAPAETSDDSDGGVSTPLIIGGVLLLGGGAALAAGGGGGKKNVAPTLPATGTATTNEDTAVTVTVTATDPGDTVTYAASGATNGTVTGGANGAFVFTPTANFNGTGTFTVTATDSKGLTATQTVTVTVTAVNDAPVAAADVLAVNEDAAIVSGNVSTNDTDVDTGDTKAYTLTNGPIAGLTLNANGSYTFDASNAAYQNLAGGATRAVVANYTLTDSKGATSTSTLTITVTGVNDAPVATAATNTATEDAATPVTGQLVATDVDTGAALTYAISGTAPAGLTISSTGAYSFNPANAAYQDLGAGATRNVVANYTVTDDKGATSTSTLTITVTGVNDAPVAVARTAAATEDALPAITGSLAATDVDAGDTLTYSIVGATPAGFALTANGNWTFDPASYDSLGAGQTQNVVVNYSVADGKGGTSASTLTITVTGVNDAPVAVNDVAAVTEGASVNGSVATNDTDADSNAVLTYSIVGAATPGLTFNPNGSYIFNAADAAYDNLAGGATRVVNVNYAVSDGTATSNATLAVTVTGVNDAPVITTGATATVDENAATTTVVYDAAATDVDTGQQATLVYSLTGVDAALFNINAATGEVRLNASANFEARTGYAFTVVVTDAQGGTDTQDVAVTVNNLVDVLTIDVGDPITPVTIDASGNNPADITDVNYQFNESGTLPNDVIIQNFGSNDYIQFSTSLVSYNYNNSGGDLVITQNNGGVVSSITIDNIFDPGLQLANNEVAAEAALNAALGTTGVDYLRGSSFASVTRSADIDNDGDSLTPASATGPTPLAPVPALDASQAAVTYTENGTTANTVIISNFTADDRIVVSNSTNGAYSFNSPDNQDLVITWNNNGVVNSITLDDFFATPPTLQVILGGEATIEQFVGFDFFSYA